MKNPNEALRKKLSKQKQKKIQPNPDKSQKSKRNGVGRKSICKGRYFFDKRRKYLHHIFRRYSSTCQQWGTGLFEYYLSSGFFFS